MEVQMDVQMDVPQSNDGVVPWSDLGHDRTSKAKIDVPSEAEDERKRSWFRRPELEVT